MKFGKKKAALTGAAAALAVFAGMAIPYASAYLTDAEQTTNTFTVGKVKVDMEEPNYPGNGSDQVKNVVPNQEIAKDPQVENTGNNEAIIFADYSIPVKKLITAADDGTRQTAKMTEIFRTSSDGTTFGEGTVNASWNLLKTYAVDKDGKETEITNGTIPETAVAVKRLFGYKNPVASGTKTDPLFTKVKMANVVEGQIDSTAQDIEVKTYAIQSSNITGVDNPAATMDVYNVFVNQNKDQATKDANTSNSKNLKGDDVSQNVKDSTTTVQLHVDNTKLKVNDTAIATSAIQTEKAGVTATLTSDDPETVSVTDNGNGSWTIKGLKAGSTTLTLSADGANATVNVTVSER